MRRYASHYVYVSGRGYLKNHGVEVEAGHAVRIFPLEGEMADTEWLPGVLRVEEGKQVFHYFPFDFIALQPVAGTRRRQLP